MVCWQNGEVSNVELACICNLHRVVNATLINLKTRLVCTRTVVSFQKSEKNHLLVLIKLNMHLY